MSERPFMQLYVSDFVGDTLLLSTEHIGAYLLLLIALWNADGELPSDETKLARVARLSVKRWRKIAVDLLPFFDIHEGVLTHHRLTKELHKSIAQSISRAAAGSKGGSASALKYNASRPASAEAIASAGLNHAGASPKPYRKKDASSISKDDAAPTAPYVKLDKSLEGDVWAECERIMGKKAPTSDWSWSFPAEVVETARANLATAERAA